MSQTYTSVCDPEMEHDVQDLVGRSFSWAWFGNKLNSPINWVRHDRLSVAQTQHDERPEGAGNPVCGLAVNEVNGAPDRI